MVAIAGYILLEKLYEGSRSLVYRGQRNFDQRPVVLKMMQSDYPSLEELNRYRLEYEILSRLDGDGAIKAYDLLTDQNGLVLVLEDFGGTALQQIQANRLSLFEFLELAIALAESLGKVHAARIIHKDINPANIVFNADTKQLKLIDFGNATVLSRENPSIRSPNVLEGTLPYLSPEQTGRMNRSLDYRTDFYSLGATFYELLIGTPPFTTSDAMELIHCHLAKQPRPLHLAQPDIPISVSQIVLKLLAKNAEDRYQSAYGIKADLQCCLEQLQNYNAIAPFPLAQHDASGRLQIPQKLYGREAELASLLAGFDRVVQTANSASELLLVAGYSGVGKSALVNEIHKPITRQKGYFISGKYDQFQRNIPYSALIQAFQELIRQLLTESPQQIDRWRLQLLNALGSNSRVVIDVIPEVELIVGEQAEPLELGFKEARNRFNLVFQKFVQVFTRSEHPLVIFLDDLQWADTASLKLINLLMTAPDSQFLFLVGAYRSNEVNAVHPLQKAIDGLINASVSVSEIELLPLTLPSITQLIADTFQCEAERATPLALLILQVTEGNPFFINEFLKSLHQAGLLNFEGQQGRWEWDLSQIRAAQMPESVAELMTRKIQKLNSNTQQALKLAACIGNQFDSETLSIISESSPAVLAGVWESVQEGLVLPLGENYKFASIKGSSDDLIVSFKFLHDRVQQVAYSLIPESEKQAIHHAIGHLLLAHGNQQEREERIFDIVNQLNVGINLMTRSQQEELAALNLIAGKKAKDSAAYETATRYLLTGITLLGTNLWQRHYKLALELHQEAAESTYLHGDFTETERLIGQILQQAQTVLDRLRAYQISANIYTAQNNMQAVLDTIVNALRQLGEPVPRNPTRLRVGLELLRTRFWIVGRRSLAELEALPPMTDPHKLAAVELLGSAGLASVNVNPLLIAILALRVVNLVVRYGSSSSSAVQGVAYGVMLRAGLGDIEGAYRFSQVSLRLLDRLEGGMYRAMAVVAYESCIRHWKEPLRRSLPVLLNAYQEGLELGNQEYASLAISVNCLHQFFVGEPLPTVADAFQNYQAQLRRFKQEAIVYQMQPWHQLVLNFQCGISPSKPVEAAFDEAELLPFFAENRLGIPLFYTYITRLIWHYHCRNYAAALHAAQLAAPLQESAPVTPAFALRFFYSSLACLALCTTGSPSARQRYLQQVASHQRRAKRWAKYCPANYLHRYELVEAERSRILNRPIAAMRHYDRAIAAATAQEYLHEAAIANELAGAFYLSLGQERVAQAHLLDARYGYLRWGATFKVEQLDSRYPELHRLIERSSEAASLRETGSSRSSSRDLDLETVIQAAQAISSEIVFDRLLEKLLQLAIENAGAQKVFLLLAHGEALTIEAAAQIERPVLVQSRSFSADELPISIINYVQRTRETVVLRDAVSEGLFTTDPFIIANQPRSILCSPILNQGNLTGILYLENNLATDAFTPERLTVLNILSAQAAIALENASFYRTLEYKVEERTLQLAEANQRITLLNQQLQSENLRMSAELDVTRQLQQMILPKEAELNQISGLSIAGFMQPADEVGGDYYDVLQNNGSVAIGIGDVTGHGLESGVLMLMLQTAIRTLLAAQETNTTRLLSTLNQVIYENIQRMNSDRTLSLSLLEYQAGRVKLSGQHEEVLIVRVDGKIERISTDELGFPIGLVEDITAFVAQTEVQLNSGDGIVLYTDGITEATNLSDELYGIERLCQVVSQHWSESTQRVRQAIIDDVHRHIGKQKIFDDITLLVIKQEDCRGAE